MHDDKRSRNYEAIVLADTDDEPRLDGDALPAGDEAALRVLLRILEHVRSDLGLPDRQAVVWRAGAAFGDVSIDTADGVNVRVSVITTNASGSLDDAGPAVDEVPIDDVGYVRIRPRCGARGPSRVARRPYRSR